MHVVFLTATAFNTSRQTTCASWSLSSGGPKLLHNPAFPIIIDVAEKAGIRSLERAGRLRLAAIGGVLPRRSPESCQKVALVNGGRRVADFRMVSVVHGRLLLPLAPFMTDGN
jgi:hypothetical protein